MTFDDLDFTSYPLGGNNSVISIVSFSDGWELQVVRFAGAEGFELERYEVTTKLNNNPTVLPTITNPPDAMRRWIKPHQITKLINDMPEAINKL